MTTEERLTLAEQKIEILLKNQETLLQLLEKARSEARAANGGK